MAETFASVDKYLASLPDDRREALTAVREVILKNLDSDYEEGIQYGMIGYYVPHRIYPAGYHCDPKQPLPFAVLGSKKNFMSLHLMCLYHTGAEPGSPAEKLFHWFTKAWTATGKKLDMGKACINFKRVEDVPLEVIGECIRKVPAATWIKMIEATVATAKKKKPAKTAARRSK